MTLFCNCSISLPKCCLKGFEEEDEIHVVESFPSLITSAKSRDALKRPSGPQQEISSLGTDGHTDTCDLAEIPTSPCSQTDNTAAPETMAPLSSSATDVDVSASSPPTAPPVSAHTSLIGSSILGPVVQSFQAALELDKDGEVVHATRESLIQGFEGYCKVLDKVGNIGNYLATNTKKLRESKATASETDYEAWMLSELPVHAATKYKEFVDQSAWMGHLWIAWTLEFFVEMFANLSKGLETVASIDSAYTKTLYAHHNFLQRSAFKAAVKKMPARSKFYTALQGQGAPDDVVRDMMAFVAIGRPLVRYLFKISDVVDKRLQAERKAYLNPK